MSFPRWATAIALVLCISAAACGGGAPIRYTVGDLEPITFSIDSILDELSRQLRARGYPVDASGIPEQWPAELPAIDLQYRFDSQVIPIDLTPDDPAKASTYSDINKQYAHLIERIELNEVTVLVMSNTSNIALPAVRLRISGKLDARADTPEVWQTMAVLPSIAAGQTGETHLEFLPGGETALDTAMASVKREAALELRSDITYSSRAHPALPRGAIVLRVIPTLTFFVNPSLGDIL